MQKNIIPYPTAEDWAALAARAGDNPHRLRQALALATAEIAHLRRECLRHGGAPTRRTDPERIGREPPRAPMSSSVMRHAMIRAGIMRLYPWASP